jgi:hypothetical protein
MEFAESVFGCGEEVIRSQTAGERGSTCLEELMLRNSTKYRMHMRDSIDFTERGVNDERVKGQDR